MQAVVCIQGPLFDAGSGGSRSSALRAALASCNSEIKSEGRAGLFLA